MDVPGSNRETFTASCFAKLLSHGSFGRVAQLAEQLTIITGSKVRVLVRPSSKPIISCKKSGAITGRLERAGKIVREILQEQPNLSLANVQHFRQGIGDLELERLRDGLCKTGMPERRALKNEFA